MCARRKCRAFCDWLLMLFTTIIQLGSLFVQRYVCSSQFVALRTAVVEDRALNTQSVLTRFCTCTFLCFSFYRWILPTSSSDPALNRIWYVGGTSDLVLENVASSCVCIIILSTPNPVASCLICIANPKLFHDKIFGTWTREHLILSYGGYIWMWITYFTLFYCWQCRGNEASVLAMDLSRQSLTLINKSAWIHLCLGKNMTVHSSFTVSNFLAMWA